jgi:hypothetical protein
MNAGEKTQHAASLLKKDTNSHSGGCGPTPSVKNKLWPCPDMVFFNGFSTNDWQLDCFHFWERTLMPLVNISIPKGKSADYVKAIADAVNSAVLAAFEGFPADDRYQIIHEHESYELEYQKRTGDRVMLDLIMRSGEKPESKKAFYKKVVENLESSPGIDPANVLITITENHDIDWSFRDGVAQFVL